jgi:hypothetical protein
MNYQVRVSGDIWAGSPVILAEIIEPKVDFTTEEGKALISHVCNRALEIQKARNLPLPATVLIETQD